VKLIKDLFQYGIPATGPAAENRKGFPETMKGAKQWARRIERGSMRWSRDGVCLAQQWKDNRPVTILSSIERADNFVTVSRHVKVNGQWQKDNNIKQPKSIDSYNSFMNGVDRSDQLIGTNKSLQKCMRWWKVLFFHIIDIAVVNSYILFQYHRSEHPEDEALKRNKKFSLTEFREEIVRQLAGLDEYDQPPVHKPPSKQPGLYEAVHIPTYGNTKRNCKVCYKRTKKELKVLSYCSAPQCQVYLHCTADKNCFAIWHGNDYVHDYIQYELFVKHLT
jgi:hypothetical protein